MVQEIVSTALIAVPAFYWARKGLKHGWFASYKACADGSLLDRGRLYAADRHGPRPHFFGVMRHCQFLLMAPFLWWACMPRTFFLITSKSILISAFCLPGLALFIFGYLVYMALIRPIRDRSHFMQILMTNRHRPYSYRRRAAHL